VEALPNRKHAARRPLTARTDAWRATLALASCAALCSFATRGDGPQAATPAAPPPAIVAPPPQAPSSPAHPALASAQSLGLVETKIDVHTFRVVESYSGPVSYYRLVEDPAEPFLRAIYRPPLETVTLGIEIPEHLRQGAKRLRWKWRAMVLPKGGDECRDQYGDSAAVVYVSWKRGLKWYSLKYVWSAVGKLGQVCDQRRNLFVVQDTVIRQTGGPTGVWIEEEIDPAAEFRAHFENGNPHADIPDFVGIGVMSDGDQTKSVSAADYTGFSILH
jgi:Protein of unknown function (DUF3047)